MLKEELQKILKEGYEQLSKMEHKPAYFYNTGGHFYAYVSDILELKENSICIGNVYDFETVKTLHNELTSKIYEFYPNATFFDHNKADYPYEDIWREYSVNGKLVVSLQWAYGSSYSYIEFKVED